MLLAAAGLLEGYEAATHWAAYDALQAMEVKAVHKRVVRDRNRITGGGVTAGLDFGLELLAQLCGEDTARLSQLMLEYDPRPPFNCGSPDTAEPRIKVMAATLMKDMTQETVQLARAAYEKRTARAAYEKRNARAAYGKRAASA